MPEAAPLLSSPSSGVTVERGKRPAHHLSVLLLYIAVLSILYAPVLFGGKSMLAPLFVPHGTVADGVYAKQGRSPANTFNIDIGTPAYYETPVNRLVGDIYLSGELPLWNPYQAVGTPLAAQYSTRAFFPYQILEDISPAVTWDFFMLGRLIVAGFFTYLFLFAVGLSPGAAFFGGLLYMLSGSFAWFINLEQLVNTAMMIPVLMYAVESMAIGRQGRLGWGRIRSRCTAAGAVVIGLLLLAGQPEVALYASVLCLLWFILRVLKTYGRKELLPSLTQFGTSYLLGLGLAAPLLALFIELFFNSFHIHPPGGSLGMEGLLNWKSLFVYLTPAGSVFPTNPEMVIGGNLLVEYKGLYQRFLPINGVWDTLGGYSGIVPVYLAFVGLLLCALRRRFAYRAELVFCVSIFLVILLKNLKVAPFIWIGALPMFDMVWSLRWAGPVMFFSLCAAAAFSVELLLGGAGVKQTFTAKRKKEPLERSRRGGAGLPFLLSLTAFVLLLLFYLLYSFLPVLSLSVNSKSVFNSIMEPFVTPSLLCSSIATLVSLFFAALFLSGVLRPRYKGRFALVAALCVLSITELWWAMPRGYGHDWLVYKWLPFSIGLVCALFFYFNKKLLGVVAALLFFVTFLYIDSTSLYGLPKRQNPFVDAPYVDFIKGRPGSYRAAGFYGALFPNFASPLKLYDIHYVNSLVLSTFHDFRKFYLTAETFDEGPSSVLWFSGRPERSVISKGSKAGAPRFKVVSTSVERDIVRRIKSYSLLGVKYFVFPEDYGKSGGGLRGLKSDRGPLFPVLYDKEVVVLENPYALARAYVVYETVVADTYTEAQKRADSRGFDLRKKAVTEVRVELEANSATGNGQEHGVKGGGTLKAGASTLITGYSANTVTVEVKSETRGLLVLTDNFYPGWKVYVNGKKSSVIRVNGLVRGVVVNAGESTVVFKYSPASFKVGSLLFLLSLLSTGYIFITGAKVKDGRVAAEGVAPL